MQARHSNVISNQFTVGNGVQQGDVLSLIWFTVYINYFYLTNMEQQLRRRLFYCLNDLALSMPSLIRSKEMLIDCENVC